MTVDETLRIQRYLMDSFYSTPTRLSTEPLGLSRIMVPAKYRVGRLEERVVIRVHTKVSQTNASCLFFAEHDNIIPSLTLCSITYQVSECDPLCSRS